jgi:hypothetical protein
MGAPAAAAAGAGQGQGEGKEYPGRLTLYVFLTCTVAATGGLIVGYDIGISGNRPFHPSKSSWVSWVLVASARQWFCCMWTCRL